MSDQPFASFTLISPASTNDSSEEASTQVEEIHEEIHESDNASSHVSEHAAVIPAADKEDEVSEEVQELIHDRDTLKLKLKKTSDELRTMTMRYDELLNVMKKSELGTLEKFEECEEARAELESQVQALTKEKEQWMKESEKVKISKKSGTLKKYDTSEKDRRQLEFELITLQKEKKQWKKEYELLKVMQTSEIGTLEKFEESQKAKYMLESEIVKLKNEKDQWMRGYDDIKANLDTFIDQTCEKNNRVHLQINGLTETVRSLEERNRELENQLANKSKIKKKRRDLSITQDAYQKGLRLQEQRQGAEDRSTRTNNRMSANELIAHLNDTLAEVGKDGVRFDLK